MINLIKKKIKLYLDTSIINYIFAEQLPEKMRLTKRLFRYADEAKYEFFVSDVVLRELRAADEPKRTKLLSKVEGIKELLNSSESEELANEYVHNKVISKNFIDDARHVAIAVCNNLDAIVSWNYKHLVNINKTKQINIINEMMGYKHIEIISPEEVGDEDV